MQQKQCKQSYKYQILTLYKQSGEDNNNGKKKIGRLRILAAM